MESKPRPDAQLRNRRIPFSRRVLITPKDGSERRYESAVDLSLGGMFISTYLPLEVGEEFDIETQIDQLKFRASVRVVWIRATAGNDDEPAGMAVAFLNLSTPQKRLLHREITYHLQGGGELRVGVPPNPNAKPRNSTARTDRLPDSPAKGLWSRVTSILGR